MYSQVWSMWSSSYLCKAGHGKEMPDKEDRINVVHKGGGEVRHPELSSTATTVTLPNYINSNPIAIQQQPYRNTLYNGQRGNKHVYL